MALTLQKRRYAEARLAGKGKKESAIEAGCPEKTAAQAACRLEKDLDVQAVMGRISAKEVGLMRDPPAIDHGAYIPEPKSDPLEFMRALMNDIEAEPRLRLDAAKALASFTVAKPGEQGKKEQKADAAKVAAKGKFGSAAPPLRAV